MAYTRERLDEIVQSLQGTCQSLEGVLEDGESEDDKELCEHIDQEIFLCPACNWWCERGEGHESDLGEDVCDDCYDSGFGTHDKEDDE